MYILYLIIMLYIDIYLLHCIIHHSNVCDIDRNSCTLCYLIYTCNVIILCFYWNITQALIYLGCIFYIRY